MDTMYKIRSYFLEHQNRSASWMAYLWSLVGVCAASVPAYFFNNIFGEGGSVQWFLLPVIFSSWFSGMWTGLFTTICAIVASLIIIRYSNIGAIHAAYYYRMVMFAIVATTISVFQSMIWILGHRIRTNELAALQKRDMQTQEMLRLYEELKAAKELAENNLRAKDQFLAALSHELRTPLTPVHAMLDGLMRFNQVPPALRSHMEMMQRNVEMEISLIDDLLDVTRSSHGKWHLHMQDVHMHDLIHVVLENLQTDIKERQLIVDLQLNATNCYICGDHSRLQQVVSNLVRNSIKFTVPPGKITIKSVNEGNVLRIKVIDTGRGIDHALLPKLFKPFEQGDAPPGKKQNQGLGLGLSIVKSLVTEHGGTIDAFSEGPTRGATFTMQFQTIDHKPVSVPSIASALVPSKIQINRWKVLLVEDHADTRRSIQELLEWSGFTVLAANDVESAINTLRVTPVDLLLSDIGLPDGTGIDLLQKVNDLPIKAIALTGFGQDEDVDRCLAAGFARHVTKPVNIEVLVQTITEVMNQKDVAHA